MSDQIGEPLQKKKHDYSHYKEQAKVLVDGVYYSDGERCCHCYRPFLSVVKAGKKKGKDMLCRDCMRMHRARKYKKKGRKYRMAHVLVERSPFGDWKPNKNCPACRATYGEGLIP
jgi:Zn-finger protein